MSTSPAAVPRNEAVSFDRTSCKVVTGTASNELVFAVVGHAGSGTSEVADSLVDVLNATEFGGRKFQVLPFKARDVIVVWAELHKEVVPTNDGSPSLDDVTALQNLGDKMRAEPTGDGSSDHAAVARALVSKIREGRANSIGLPVEDAMPVNADGAPRAYVLDSLRHPEEVQLLRHIYGPAFVLVGVVCEEEKRLERIQAKYHDAGRKDALEFMKRDAGVKEKYGQHVNDAFHLSDFFVDNTPDRYVHGTSNADWQVYEHLSRLMKILIHDEIVRPSTPETAMYHAHVAAMRSACLSRQVGAALVDREGTIVSTGTNEVPKAGGGVYGEGFDGLPVEDGRCAFRKQDKVKQCKNTHEQNEIIQELINEVPELLAADEPRKKELASKLRETRIGGLIEFSRAVHAEMDAIISAARSGVGLAGTRLFVTTFPCHYCAPHIVTAGVDEVQYIEPYPKSRALALHDDAIQVESTDWKAPSKGGTRVLFRPFSGVAPRLYERAFQMDRDLKNKQTGRAEFGLPIWGQPWHLGRVSYEELEADLTKREVEACQKSTPKPALLK